MNKRQINSIEQLREVIEYILWSYDVNCAKIADKQPKVYVQDLSNVWTVKVTYTGEVIKADILEDPTIQVDDRTILADGQFNLLKTEGFRQLTKYVEDICEEIAKVNIEV